MKRSGFKKKTWAELFEKKNSFEEAIKKGRKALKRAKKPTYRQAKGKKQVKRWGVKLWSIKKADLEFSKWLREKIGKCEKCGTTEGLTCSHYIGRAEYATRYLEKNCDVLCWSCHKYFEDRKMFEYRDWKINKHGQEEHDKLRNMKYEYVSTSQSIYDLMKLMGKVS